MDRTTQQSRQSVVPLQQVAPSRQAICAQRQQQDLVIDSLRRKLLGLQAKERPVVRRTHR